MTDKLIELEAEEMWTPYHDEVNSLLIEEKAARHENDAVKLSELCRRVLQISFDNAQWSRLRFFIIFLVKRRGQAKKAIVELIQLAQELVEKMPNREEKMNLVVTLREATEGKLFLESEYAQCTRIFAEMKVEDGDLKEAAKYILEVQVETYGSLKKDEKIEYILYQMGLVLDLKDFVRTQIIMKKVNKKNLNDEGLEKLKVKFYQYSIQYYIHEKDHFEVAKSYQIIYDTVTDEKNKELGFEMDLARSSFENFVSFLLFSPFGPETLSLINTVSKTYRKELDNHKVLQKYVHKFLLTELLPLDEDRVAKEMEQFLAFQKQTEHHAVHLKKLSKLIIQHNIRVIEQYYERIRLERLSQLIGVGLDRCEHEIADMVHNQSVVAKIDRVEGVVSFKKKKHVNDTLNEWNSDLKKLLGKVEETCHLINRERVIT